MAVEEFPHIDGYEIDSLLGQGGMGAVYKGRRISDGRLVAIKVIRELSDVNERELQYRFRREIDVSKTFAHPYVTLTLDGGFDNDGQPYLVMEFIDGTSLEDLIHSGTFDERAAITVGRHICEALSYIHSQGIQHRDVKPSNIIVVSPERSVLVDFGLALDIERTRISLTSAVVGTMRFVAPERLKGQKGSPASDVFGLGVTLFYAITTRMPYLEDDFFTYVVGLEPSKKLSIQAADIQRAYPKLSKHFCQLIAKAITLDEGDRFKNSQEFLEAIDNPGHLQSGIPVQVKQSPTPKQKTPKATFKLRWLSILLLIFMFLFVSYGSNNSVQTSFERNNAKREVFLLKRKLLVDNGIPSRESTLNLAKMLKTVLEKDFGQVSELALGRHFLYQEAIKTKNYTKAAKLFELFLENHCAEWYSAENRLPSAGMNKVWTHLNIGLPHAHTVAIQITKADKSRTKHAMVPLLNSILAYVCDSVKRIEYWHRAHTLRQEISKIVNNLRGSAEDAKEWQAVGECLMLLYELDSRKEARAEALNLYNQYMDELEKLSDPGSFITRGNRALLRGQILKIDPTNASHRINLGVERKYQLAAISFGEIAIELCKNREQLFDLLYALSTQLCDIGNAAKALKMLEEHPVSPTDSENTQSRYYHRLSMTLMDLKRFTEARKAIKRCEAFAHTEAAKRRIKTSLLRINTLQLLK